VQTQLPTAEDYFRVVRDIAAGSLKRFGFKNFRLWCEGSGGEFGEGAITKYIEEQVAYSSWIQSDFHVRQMVKFSRRQIPQPVNHNMNFLRSLMIRAMAGDIKDEAAKLILASTPSYWKLRFVKAKRFVQYVDLDERDTEVDYKGKDEHANETKANLERQYIEAKLPVPEIELVAFNKDHQEIKQ